MRAVRDVHRTGHVHLDIKTQNFLVDYSAGDGLRLFIGDFGSVREVNHVRHRVTEEFGAYTLFWTSPERVFEQHVSFAADMWSMACVGIEIFSRMRTVRRSMLMKFQDGSTEAVGTFLRRALREKTSPLSILPHNAASFFKRFDEFTGGRSSDATEKAYRDVCDDVRAIDCDVRLRSFAVRPRRKQWSVLRTQSCV